MHVLNNVGNFLSILFLGQVCILFQSTMIHEFFGIYKPNLILIIVTYIACNRYIIEGAFMAYLLGYIIQLNSGAPTGLYPVIMVLTFCTAKLLSEAFFINTLLSRMFLVIVATIISKFYLLLILTMYESASVVWRSGGIWQQTLAQLFPMVVLNFLLTPIIFFILRFIDKTSGKDIPTRTGSKEPRIRLYS